MAPRREHAVTPPREQLREHKGFVLKRGKDGLITIIDANGNPLSETVTFIEYETASAFLDRWVAKKEGGRDFKRADRQGEQSPRAKKASHLGFDRGDCHAL